jgi:integrase
LEDFRRYLLDELERAPTTTEAYIARLGYLERALGKPWQAITSEDTRALKRERKSGELGISSTTLRSWFVALRCAFIWAQDEGLEVDERVLRTPMPKLDSDGPPPLSGAKLKALFDACHSPLEHRLVYYGAYVGTRIGESAAIAGEMWEDGWLRFPSEKKQGAIREVPIHPELWGVRYMMWASLPTDRSTLQKVKRRLAKRVGFHFVAHQLRKTFSTTLQDSDVPAEVIRSLLGHSHPDSMHRYGYGDVSRKRKLEAIASLDYFAPIVLETWGGKGLLGTAS